MKTLNRRTSCLSARWVVLALLPLFLNAYWVDVLNSIGCTPFSASV